MEYDEEEVERHLRRRLNDFSLYDSRHYVGVVIRDAVYIRYAPTDRDWKNRGKTYFNLQVEPEVCYILSFNIEEKFWRQGHGTSMVMLIEDFVSEEFGVRRFVATPSGMAKEHRFYESCGYQYFNRREVEKVV
tara:strand:+ start:280 stop:678 length:399 start_codon:yes stop_codon:yes gene_type:complete